MRPQQQRSYRDQPNIVAGLFESAKRYGDKTALISNNARISYAELARRILDMSSVLASEGLQSGSTVTLYGANSIDWVVSYYAVLATGASVNPINSMLTAEEVEYIARDCVSDAIIGDMELLARLHSLKTKGVIRALFCFGDSPSDEYSSLSNSRVHNASELTPPEIDSKSVATICYTSGTTGYPKGAIHTHEMIWLNSALTSLMHGRNKDDVVVSSLPMPHVYGAVSVNSTLLSGGAYVIHNRFDEVEILKSFEEERATLFEGVPTMYLNLLNHSSIDNCDLRAMRACTVGGQTMPVAKLREVERKFGCPIIELWGMTELAGVATTFAHNGPIVPGSIGVPLPYFEARIAVIEGEDSNNKGERIGELLIKGPTVMLGYKGNQQASRETVAEDGWLRTGDLARMDDEGFLYIVDRKKDMILTGGYNVYPAELERVISEIEDVAMVAVGPVTDEQKGELAKAYIMLKPCSSLTVEQIKEYCVERLAPYKRPRLYQFVDDLPKTSSGKVLRRKLHELDEKYRPST